jgi:hypothetical protein
MSGAQLQSYDLWISSTLKKTFPSSGRNSPTLQLVTIKADKTKVKTAKEFNFITPCPLI